MLLKLCGTTIAKGRTTFHWLNKVWNNVDTERIKLVGPDRACAEWLMKNGAVIKWMGHKEYLTDYNKLPAEGERHYLEEVDATNSSIMDIGFDYFRGCNHIKLIKLHKCFNIEDNALKELSILKNSLNHLQVSSCGNVSEKGLLHLVVLENLETLVLYDLPRVKDKTMVMDKLTQSLKKCRIDFT